MILNPSNKKRQNTEVIFLATAEVEHRSYQVQHLTIFASQPGQMSTFLPIEVLDFMVTRFVPVRCYGLQNICNVTNFMSLYCVRKFHKQNAMQQKKMPPRSWR
jgi:hypothetical protein